MYIIYRVDNDDDEISKTPIGVVNGDESTALEWIRKNNFPIYNSMIGQNGIPYPRYECRYIAELEA